MATLAVIASLVFVGMHLRQNAQAQRVTATAASVSNWQDTVLQLATSEHPAPAASHVSEATDAAALDNIDVVRMTAMLVAASKNTEFSYYRHQDDEITDGLWEAALNGLLASLASPMARQVVWPRVKSQLSPLFAAYITDEIKRLP